MTQKLSTVLQAVSMDDNKSISILNTTFSFFTFRMTKISADVTHKKLKNKTSTSFKIY